MENSNKNSISIIIGKVLSSNSNSNFDLAAPNIFKRKKNQSSVILKMTDDLLFSPKQNLNLLLTLVLALVFFSCGKKRTSIPLEALNTPTTAPIYDITFTHIDTGYAIGGAHWQHSEWLTTTDGGSTWSSDTFANNGLLDIDFVTAETVVAVGFDGQAFYKTDANIWWLPYYPPEGENMNAVDFWDENTGVVVGGKNFASGVIYRLNNVNGATDTVHYPLTHELRDVQFTDANTVHTVGYGYAGKSTDAGLTWQASDVQGDFLYALHFINQEVGYAVGRSGTIIKTTNAGEKWEKIRNGNSLFVSNERFRDVWFKDENEGYIVGDNGLFWWTDDGGDSWKIVEDTPDVTFNRIEYQNGVGFIAAEEGRIYRFE